MLSLLIASAFLGALPAGASPSDDDRAVYQAARDQAGRDPEAHVKLALWSERHGMEPQRLEHLALALLADPENATARALLGMVKDRNGRWVKTDRAIDPARQDPRIFQALGEYNRKRALIDDHDPDEHWKLALWCEDQGLAPEARAHFSAVVRLQPGRDAAWKRLGCKKVKGRWMTEAQAAAEKALKQAQDEADRTWKPKLETWKRWLSDPRKRVEAERLLATVSDPLAVRSVWKVFVSDRSPNHPRAVQLLGQIDSITSSTPLAVIAVFSPDPEVRRIANETLAQRDPREFAWFLIGLLREPLKYQVQPVNGPGSPGVLMVEGENANWVRYYRPPAMPMIPFLPGDTFMVGPNGLPILTRTNGYSAPKDVSVSLGNYTQNQLMALHSSDSDVQAALRGFQANPRRETMNIASLGRPNLAAYLRYNPTKVDQVGYFQIDRIVSLPETASMTTIPVGQIALNYQRSAAVAEVQLENDLKTVEFINHNINLINERVAELLHTTTGETLGADRESWDQWWTSQLGYRYYPKPAPIKASIVQDIPLMYYPPCVQVGSLRMEIGPEKDKGADIRFVTYNQRTSCFGAGTPVHTLTGIRPIEDIQVGDLVLSQNTKNGTLSYAPVLLTHHNPPSKTFVVNIDGESVTASTFHRFWIAGQGWKMARELKTGDVIRTLDGLHSVDSIEAGQVQKVYNLDVAEGHSFFVAQRGVLVHDNTVPDLRQTPFDQPPELAVAGASD